MRTFVAVPLPPECHAFLAGMQAPLRALDADVRWTAVASIHLTVKFLGEIDPDLVPRLSGAMRGAAAAAAPFCLTLRGLGTFPNPRSPRVIWCGVEGDIGELSRLQQAVESTCASFGLAPEEREFRPHLTLGRVQGKRNLQRLLDCIKIGSASEQAFSVDRYHVYRSVLTPRGAIYSVLETVELTGKTDV